MLFTETISAEATKAPASNHSIMCPLSQLPGAGYGSQLHSTIGTEKVGEVTPQGKIWMLFPKREWVLIRQKQHVPTKKSKGANFIRVFKHLDYFSTLKCLCLKRAFNILSVVQ